MPYAIRKVGKKYCLFLKGSGKRVGCHASHAEAVAQQQAIEIAKHSAAGVPRGITLRETVGPTRTEKFQGKEYVVLPIIALVEGVIWPINSPHPDLVPEGALRVAPSNWDGRPVMADEGHPTLDGEQVSANTPDVLKTAIGMVFNAHVEGKRLVMEAWIDPTLPAAQKVLARVQAGELVEVSVGVLVVEEPTPGVWEGKPYFAIWRVILPDHLAILPEGDEGACSGSMGCGIRTATKRVHLVTAAGMELTEEARVKVTDEKMQAFLKTAVDAADPFKELHLLDLDASVCVYETAAGKTYRQAFEEQADETVKLAGDRLEVEPIVYYEPTNVTLKTAKGARHSQTDMARIQAMHDHTVDLGAQCAAAPKAAAAAPCGCKHQKENPIMARTAEQRTALVASLKTKLKGEAFAALTALAAGKGDIIDAIIAQIKDKLGLSDAAAADIANLDEATIVELAGLAAAPKEDDGSVTPPSTADAALATAAAEKAAVLATAAAKKESEAEFLARNPELARIVSAARSRNDARKAHLVGVLKTAQTHFTEAALLKMDLDKLEEVAVLCKAAVVADVDFGAQVPRATTEEVEDGVSPEPIDLGARIRAARGKK